jgi:hypothetical protein
MAVSAYWDVGWVMDTHIPEQVAIARFSNIPKQDRWPQPDATEQYDEYVLADYVGCSNGPMRCGGVVAFDSDGNVVGRLRAVPDNDARDMFVIGATEVRPDLRRKGIATAMLYFGRKQRVIRRPKTLQTWDARGWAVGYWEKVASLEESG